MAHYKALLKKIWYFIWEDESVWSWVLNIILAFILIKFIVYPVLGFMLQTTHPVVAVVSESMEHSINLDYSNTLSLCGKSFSKKTKISFDGYWDICGNWYEANFKIAKDDFSKFSFMNGFNKGDIMVLKGANSQNIRIGDVIVFTSKKSEPIIHRVVNKWGENSQDYYYTKGDNNKAPIKDSKIDETKIPQSQIIGKAVLKIPFLGYIKIWFTELISYFR